MNAREIGARIEARMLEQKLEPIDLAAAARVDTTSVRRWFSGRSAPRSPHLAALARRLDVTADYLVGLTDLDYSNTEIFVRKLRGEGVEEEIILDMLRAVMNQGKAGPMPIDEPHETPEGTPPPEEISEEPSGPPEAAPPSPGEIGEKLSRRPGGAKARRGRVPRPGRNPEPPPTSGEEEPS